MENFNKEISDIIASLNEVEDFVTTKTQENPKTGAIEWDVDYTPNLKTLYRDINNIVKKFEELEKEGNIPEIDKLVKIGKSLRNKYSRILKKFNELKEQSSTAQGGAIFTPGEGAQYATPNAFNKNTTSKGTKNNYYYKLGYKDVPKKIKGSGLEVKQLFESSEDFQESRIEMFDKIEEELNSLSPLISNAKNKTIEYYNNNRGSYAIVTPTDLIFDYIKDIKNILNK